MSYVDLSGFFEEPPDDLTPVRPVCDVCFIEKSENGACGCEEDE